MVRRFFTRILMVVLIAACGYNGWQVRQMQGRLAQLQAQVAAQHVRVAQAPAAPSQSWLDQADLHAARARTAAGRADFPTAQRELERGVDDLHRAAQEPEAKTQATLTQARHTLTSLQSEADGLWRRVHPARPASVP